jgi:hypothetical protein
MYEWSPMVNDIDTTLHLFRYRLRKRRPPFFRRKLRHESQKDANNDNKKRPRQQIEGGNSENRPNLQVPDMDEEQQPARTILEGAFRKLPRLDRNEGGVVVPDSVRLKEGDRVIIGLHGKRVIGTIETVLNTVKAAYLSYDEFPTCHDEYQPVDRLRSRVAGGETSAALSTDGLHPGMHVFHVEQGGEEYRAVVKAWKQATFYLVNLELDGGADFVYKQWLARESIMDVVEEVNHFSPQKVDSTRLVSTPKSVQLTSSKRSFHPNTEDYGASIETNLSVEAIRVAVDSTVATLFGTDTLVTSKTIDTEANNKSVLKGTNNSILQPGESESHDNFFPGNGFHDTLDSDEI